MYVVYFFVSVLYISISYYFSPVHDLGTLASMSADRCETLVESEMVGIYFILYKCTLSYVSLSNKRHLCMMQLYSQYAIGMTGIGPMYIRTQYLPYALLTCMLCFHGSGYEARLQIFSSDPVPY